MDENNSDQFHQDHRWRINSCSRFMGRLVHMRYPFSRLLTVLTDTWPPKFTSTRIRADVAAHVHKATHKAAATVNTSSVVLMELVAWPSPLEYSLDRRKSIFNAPRVGRYRNTALQKRFLLAHPAINLSSLGVVLWGLPNLGHSPTIPVACKRCIRRSSTERYIPIKVKHHVIYFINIFFRSTF
jgi:hypothetical protein